MKTVKAWAVVDNTDRLVRHTLGARAGLRLWLSSLRALPEYKGCRIVRVEIREMKPKKRKP